MDVEIRFAEAGDYNSLCALCEQGDRIHCENLPHLFRSPDGPAREWKYIQSLLGDPNVALLVTEAQGKVVGFAHVVLLHSPNTTLHVPRRYAVIDNIVVDEGHRRSGIGRALMARAENWAREKGATSVELNVYMFNQQAKGLYEVLGYEGVSVKMSKSLDE